SSDARSSDPPPPATQAPRQPPPPPPGSLRYDNGPDEMPQLRPELDRLTHADGHGPAEREPVAQHASHGRAHEQLEGDHRAHRIARQPDPWRFAQQAESDRGTGAHGDAPQLDLAPQL